MMDAARPSTSRSSSFKAVMPLVRRATNGKSAAQHARDGAHIAIATLLES
jgi:hypothetical protein